MPSEAALRPDLRCYNPRAVSGDRIARFAAATLILALGLGYAVSRFPANSTDQRRLLDFSEFYAAGQMVREGQGAHLYDLREQAEFQLRVAPVHAFYLRPPFEALLFVPLTFLSYRGAYIFWVILSFITLVTAAWLISRNTNVLRALLQYTRGIPVDFGLLLVLFLTFEPTMDSFLIGQDSVFLLLVYTLVFLCLKQERDAKAGALLACGLFKFHLVLPFAVILALRRKGRFLLGFAAGAGLLVAASTLICTRSVLLAYPRMFLDPGARQLMGFQPEYAPTLRGLVALLGGSRIPAAIQISIVAVFSAVILWLTARRWNDAKFELSFSAAVIATLLTGVHAFVYDLSLLLLPVAIAIGELARRNQLLRDTPLNVALVALFVPPVHHVLIVYRVYALMSLAVLVLFVAMTRKTAGTALT